MNLILNYPEFGNLKLYDLKKILNINKVIKNFNTLQGEPYINQDYRKIIKYKYENKKFIIEPLIKSINYDTHRQNVNKSNEFNNILDVFSSISHLPDNETILLQTERITTSNPLHNFRHWSKSNLKKISFMCISKHKVLGGVLELKNKNDKIAYIDLIPGDMVVFEPRDIEYRISPITYYSNKLVSDYDILKKYSIVEDKIGYNDLLLLAYPTFPSYPIISL